MPEPNLKWPPAWLKPQPPLGVMPFDLWCEGFYDGDEIVFPTIAEWLQRYKDVNDACRRYREAGLAPPAKWIAELLGV